VQSTVSDNTYGQAPPRSPIVKGKSLRNSVPFMRYQYGSQESGLPLATAGAAPAGTFKGIDEDDDEQMRGLGSAVPKPRVTLGERWKGLKKTLSGEKTYTGERSIVINDWTQNSREGFSNNSVSTSKYNLATFLPKFLAGGFAQWSFWYICSHCLREFSFLCVRTEQFSKYANVFFLFTAAIQQIPNVSPTNRYTTIVPLSLVLLVAAIKEVQEDIVCVTPCLNFFLFRTEPFVRYSRNGINQMLSSMLARRRFFRMESSSPGAGETSTLATSSDSRVTTLSRRTWYSCPALNLMALLTLKRPIWTGAFLLFFLQ
jgi:hypothetical protein